jgi:hypothetical protein
MEFGNESVTITYHVVFGLIWLALAGSARRRSVEGQASWWQMWEPVQPSLAASQSPADATLGGIGGLVAWLIGDSLTILFSLLALDQFLAQGAFFLQAWALLLARFN